MKIIEPRYRETTTTDCLLKDGVEYIRTETMNNNGHIIMWRLKGSLDKSSLHYFNSTKGGWLTTPHLIPTLEKPDLEKEYLNLFI